MVSPNLLQPATDIDHVVERGPLPFFTECDKPSHDRFESAEIQSKKEPDNGRHGDRQHDKRHGAEPIGAGEFQNDANSGQHENQQADDLDKNIDQHAGDRQIGGYSELREKPGPDHVTAYDGEWDERINRLPNESYADKDIRPAHQRPKE